MSVVIQQKVGKLNPYTYMSNAQFMVSTYTLGNRQNQNTMIASFCFITQQLLQIPTNVVLVITDLTRTGEERADSPGPWLFGGSEVNSQKHFLYTWQQKFFKTTNSNKKEKKKKRICLTLFLMTGQHVNFLSLKFRDWTSMNGFSVGLYASTAVLCWYKFSEMGATAKASLPPPLLQNLFYTLQNNFHITPSREGC